MVSYTLLSECFAIDVQDQCDCGSIGMRCRDLMQRAVTRGIRIDEMSEAKGYRYLMLLCDVDEGLEENIAEDLK